MDINEIKKIAKENRNEFIEKFGFFLMKVSRKDLPDLIDIAIKTEDEIINKKILNDMSFILRKTKIRRIGDLLEILIENPVYYNEILNRFNEISEYFAPNNIEKVMKVLLRKNPESKLVSENLEIFLENAKTKVQALKMMEAVKHIPKCKDKINKYNLAILNLGDFHFLEKLNVGTMMKLLETGTIQYVKDIFLTYSNGDISEVKYIANGFTSTAFQAKDKIIKIGKKRIKYNGQFSKYLLQPYLRKEILDLEGNVIFTVEVQDRCITSDIDKEKIEEFMKKISSESEQFIWMDSGEENIFELLKDNTRKIQMEEDGFSYDGVLDKEPVGKKGDLVIGDTDFMYSPQEANEREDSYKTPKHKKTFSLILPTYNTEKYLSKCLNSILNQTCSDYEVLIINDGSTDKSAEIAQEYVDADSRFKLLTFENAGISEARNRGIRVAKGEYIVFIDSDDTIQPELLEKLQPYTKREIEMIRFGAVVVNETPKKDKYRFNREFYPEIISGVEALKKWNNDKRYSTVWLYCTKKDVFERSRFEFPKIKIYEDVASVPTLIANAKSVAMLDYIGYNYIQHENSVTNIKKPNKQLCNLDGFITAYDFISEGLNKYFNENPVSNEVRNELIDGFFFRMEDKFKHTNTYEKDIYAKKLFNRNRLMNIDYKQKQYFDNFGNINQRTFYEPKENSKSIRYQDTTISELGKFTYNVNGHIEVINLFRIEKKGKYNFTDRFLCMSNIDFEKIRQDKNYRKIVFKYLTSYTNLFLAESLNGGYIGEVKKEEDGQFSIYFDENTTTFANNFKNTVPKICKDTSSNER